jgi:regulatory protein
VGKAKNEQSEVFRGSLVLKANKAEFEVPMSADCLKRLEQCALYCLARREYGTQELSAKLRNAIPDCVEFVDRCIEQLLAANWLNEARYIEAFIRKEVALGHGVLRVRHALMQKKVASELIDAVLEASDIDWLALARQVKEKKFGLAMPRDVKTKAAQVRFLTYRGFDADTVRRVMNNLSEDE